jgi:hypothetical protein
MKKIDLTIFQLLIFAEVKSKQVEKVISHGQVICSQKIIKE